MPASATSAALCGGALGFMLQIYTNGVRKLPVLRSECLLQLFFPPFFVASPQTKGSNALARLCAPSFQTDPWEHGIYSIIGAGFGLSIISMEDRLRSYIEEQTQARSRK